MLVHTLEVMKLQVAFQTLLHVDGMLLEEFNVVTGARIPWLHPCKKSSHR